MIVVIFLRNCFSLIQFVFNYWNSSMRMKWKSIRIQYQIGSTLALARKSKIDEELTEAP